MPIVGEQFPGFVIEQINQRQTIHGKKDRTIDDLVYLNAKTAWVKLASGVSLKGNEKISSLGLKGVDPGMDLAKQYILFGGVSKKSEDSTILQQFEGFTTDPSKINPYNINAKQKSTNLDFGFVPPPGIESAEIKNLNRGSIKKATVKLKAYSRDQFEILDILYMRLGYTVLLEWGWSHYFTNEGKLETTGYTLTESPNGFFSEEYSSHRQFLGVIQGYRSGKDGNYDGLLAKVSNPPNTPKTIYHYIPSATGIGYFIEPGLDTNVPSTFTSNDYKTWNDAFGGLITEMEKSGRTPTFATFFKSNSVNHGGFVNSNITKAYQILPPENYKFEGTPPGETKTLYFELQTIPQHMMGI
jgi:hypothetical protein